MSCLTELLCQLSAFLKPVMNRAVEEPLFRMHHGRNTFTLEVNWAYTKEASKNLEKTAILEKKKMAANFPAKTPSERRSRHSAKNRRRQERKKAARALLRTTTSKTLITVSPDVTQPAKTPPSTSTPMDEGTPGPLSPGKESRRHHHRPTTGTNLRNGTPARARQTASRSTTTTSQFKRRPSCIVPYGRVNQTAFASLPMYK